jgi:glycosyltransferase involved in cell wall biosynthesis
MEYPKISIITPSFNQAPYLTATIESVLSQNYPNLEYIILDGGSTDGSVDIIKSYESKLHYWVSEKDGGLYNALQKGFEISTGEIMGWINSDDMLHRQSFFVLANIFTNIQSVNWVQGRPTQYDETGMTVATSDPMTSPYSFYLKKYRHGVTIQQESTYWRRALWDRAGAYISTEYKYAGDFELWIRFFRHDKLYNTTALIGGFRERATQISKVFNREYMSECDKIVDSEILGAYCKRKIRLIKFIEDYLFKLKILRRLLRGYHQSLLGNGLLISFDFYSGKFYI